MTESAVSCFRRVASRWGWWWLGLVALVSLVQLGAKGESGHFLIFSTAARELWAAQNPYLTHYPSGHFNYSPAAGLFFYGPFSFIPHTWGLVLYMGLSVTVLAVGLVKFFRVFQLKRHLENLFLFLFMLSSELIGNVLNARFETFTLGCWLLVLSFRAKQKLLFWSYFLLAALSNFKLQTIPLAGLLLVWELRQGQGARATMVFVASLVFWHFSPMVVFRAAEIAELGASMRQNLLFYTEGGWIQFQHIFRLVYRVTGWSANWQGVQIILVCIGVGLASLVFALRGKLPSGIRLLTVASLASIYVVACLPMSQSAGYILYAPALFAGFFALQHQHHSVHRRTLWVVLFLSFFCVSVSYSDLTPQVWRAWFFELALKSVGAIALLYPLIRLPKEDLGVVPVNKSI